MRIGHTGIRVLVTGLVLWSSVSACGRLKHRNDDGHSDPDGAKGKVPEDERPSDLGEGVPGYLTDPRSITVNDIDDHFEVVGPKGAVAAIEGTELSQLTIAMWSVSGSTVVNISNTAGDAPLEVPGTLLQIAPVGPDGSFSATLPKTLFGAGTVLMLAVVVADPGGTIVVGKASDPHVTVAVNTLAPASETRPLVAADFSDGTLAAFFAGNFTSEAPIYPEAKVGSGFVASFAGGGGTSPYAYTITVNPGGASIDNDGAFTYTPSGGAGTLESYTVRITDAAGKIEDIGFVLRIESYYTCRWAGTASASWSTATNWISCGGGVPTASDRVLISSSVSTQPTLQASTTIEGFAPGPGGGTVTINSGVTLSLTSGTETVRSSVVLQGDAETCATCRVDMASDLHIDNNAKLSLKTGVIIRIPNGKAIYVGDADSHGHLRAEGGSTPAEFPGILCTSNGIWNGIVVQGASNGNRSTLDISGLRISGWYGANDRVNLVSDYEIIAFDGVSTVGTGFPWASTSGEFIAIQSCTNALFSDTSWTDWTITGTPGTGLYLGSGVMIRVDGTTCSAFAGLITLSGSGDLYGQYRDDPNNVVTLANAASSTCTWSGTTDTDWETPSNWLNCSNGRRNVPDINDWVVIPAAPANQPTISTPQKVRGISSGTGGGTITLSSKLGIQDRESSVESDVTIASSTPTTGTTVLLNFATDLTIRNGATLTVGKGVMMFVASDGGKINVGDGASPGHFVTVGGPTATEWPLLTGSGPGRPYGPITVRGASPGERSSIAIDGLTFGYATWGTFLPPNSAAIDLVSNYNVTGLSNVSIQHSSTAAGTTGITIQNCDTELFTATTWSNLIFNDTFDGATSFNIQTNGCSGVGPFTITGSGAGYGAALDSDPFAILNWL